MAPSSAGFLVVLGGLGLSLALPLIRPGALLFLGAVSIAGYLGVFGYRASNARDSGSGCGGILFRLLGTIAISVPIGFVLTQISWRNWGPSYEGVSGPVGLHPLGVWIVSTFISAATITYLWNPQRR